jgi:hypothetical protein
MVVGTACGLWATESPSRAPYLTGGITQIGLTVAGFGSDSAPTILVEEEPGIWPSRPSESRKSQFWRTDETSIVLEKPDGGWKDGAIADLEIGDRISAWYDDDFVLESYPTKGWAGYIAVFLDQSE